VPRISQLNLTKGTFNLEELTLVGNKNPWLKIYQNRNNAKISNVRAKGKKKHLSEILVALIDTVSFIAQSRNTI